MHVKPSESVTSRLPDLVNWQGARGISARESSAVAGGDETGNSALTAFPTDAYPSNPMVAAVTNSLPPQTVANEGWESKEEGADNSADEGGSGSAHDRCSFIGYCHLPGCRSRTRRACRRLPSGCSRSSQRLPSNYLFAHVLHAEGGTVGLMVMFWL